MYMYMYMWVLGISVVTEAWMRRFRAFVEDLCAWVGGTLERSSLLCSSSGYSQSTSFAGFSGSCLPSQFHDWNNILHVSLVLRLASQHPPYLASVATSTLARLLPLVADVRNRHALKAQLLLPRPRLCVQHHFAQITRVRLGGTVAPVLKEEQVLKNISFKDAAELTAGCCGRGMPLMPSSDA